MPQVPLSVSASGILTIISLGFAVSLSVLNTSYDRDYLRAWTRMWGALAVYALMAGTSLVTVNVPGLEGVRPVFSLLAIVAAGVHLRFLGDGMWLLCRPGEPRPVWVNRVVAALLLVSVVTIFVPVTTDQTVALGKYLVRVSLLAIAWGIAYGTTGLLILREVTATSALGRRTLGWALVVYGAVRFIEPLSHFVGPNLILSQLLAFGALPLIVAVGAGMLISLLEVERTRAVLETEARTAAERTATESEAILASALASSSDPVFIADRAGRLLAFNTRFASLVAEARGVRVVAGMVVESLVGPARIDFWRNLFERGISGESQLRLETIRVRAGERPSQFALRITPVVRSGEIIGILVVGHDATEEERLRAVLAEREEWFGSMIENSSDIIFMVSADGTIEYASPSLNRMLGHEQDALTGVNGFRFVHPDDEAALRDAMERSFKRDDTVPTTIPFRAMDALGEYVALEAVSRPFIEADGTPRLIVSARDVRERQRLETELLAARRLESVGRLAGGVAHDFNNLLTAIVGNLSLLRDGPDDRVVIDGHLGEIENAVQRGAELTRRLLAFARRQMIEPRVLDLPTYVRDIERLLRRLLGETVQLEVDLPPTLGSIRMDPSALEQILVNLAVNARDAMPNGGRLTIHGTKTVIRESGVEALGVPAGAWVRVDVTDTGTGIEDGVLGQIFEPFFTTKGQKGGTGLGLATVYGTVSQAGGHVRVRSQRGEGTSFSLYFPQVEATEAAVAPASSLELPHATGRETILIIEDEASVREVTVKVLTRLGYQVLAASDGLEGVERAAAHSGQIDLILSDLVMPELGGAEAVARIRQARPAVPVIFISGFSEEALQWQEGTPSGGRLLSKPFSIEDLARTVRRALDHP